MFATQAIANTNEPAYGTILSHQVVENGHGVSLTTLFAPLLEPEIIFELTADLPEDADTQTILESVKSHQASKFQMHVIKIGSQISL